MVESGMLPSSSIEFELRGILLPEALIERGVCDEGNSKQVSRFIIAYIRLLKDSPLHSSHGPKPDRLIRRFVYELTTRPILDTVIGFSDLADSLVSHLRVNDAGSIKGPRAIPNNSIIAKEYIEWRKSGNSRLFAYMLTFLSFGKKMEYDNEEFFATALRKWLAVEDSLTSLQLPSDVVFLRRIVHLVLAPLDTEHLFPKFGPGKVSERGVSNMIDKLHVDYDAKLDRVFFQPNAFIIGEGYENGGFHPAKVIPSYDKWDPKEKRSEKRSRLKFVRKNVKTARSICMEPNAYMLLQQAVLDMIKVSLKVSPVGKFIHLQDQSVNQFLAEYGSLTNRIDTLDMSHASDSVSVELVRAIFPRKWLYFLMGTRTSQVLLPDNSVKSVKKFAPMGSALCFPVQCIIFTSIVLQAAAHYVFGRQQCENGEVSDSEIMSIIHMFSDTPNLSSGFMPLSVYGDDICVDSKLTPIVADLLAKYGFSVNLDKSFTGDQSFRESCGKYYLGGDDVSPVFYKVPLYGAVLGATDIASIVGQCNQAFALGYRSYRRYLLKELLFDVHHNLRYTRESDDTSAVRTDASSLNWRLKRRYNRDLQREEIRHISITVSDRVRASDVGECQMLEHYLYTQWVRASRFTGDDSLNTAASRGVPANTRVVWRWTPDY